MLFTFDEARSDSPEAKVFAFFRLAREKVFCKSASDSTFLDIAILGFVKEKGSPAMKDVATALRVSPPAATGVIDKLIDKGYLRRSEDSSDRRIVRLSVTDKGSKEVENGKGEALRSVGDMLSALSEKEREAFGKLLTKILNHNA